jgi:fumarate reductase subunit C
LAIDTRTPEAAVTGFKTTGERVILWTLPPVAIIWVAAFLLFPGFTPPMSPKASAAEVAAFYRDDLSRIRYSMILFNWFCVALIPILMLIVERMRRMAHRTPVLRYCVIGVSGAAPIAFLTSTVFWLIAAFRPDRSPDLTLLCNDLAWITFTCGVPFLVALCLFLALAIVWDDQERPVFPRWVARFNLGVAIALVPAAFAGLTQDGVFAWDGFVSFWVKNVAITLWLIVMAATLWHAMDAGDDEVEART